MLRDARGDRDATTRAERRRMRGLGPAARVALPIAPMIDVVFLLLLYFVLTSGFADQARLLRTEAPREAAADASERAEPADALELEEETLVIRVRAGSDARTTIELGLGLAQPSDAEALERILRDVLLTPANPRGVFDPGHPVRIVADRELPWEEVVRVFQAASGAGFRAIAFGGDA